MVVVYASATLCASEPTLDFSAPMESFSAEWQARAETTMQFCAGYMVQDFCFMVLAGAVYGVSHAVLIGLSTGCHHVRCRSQWITRARARACRAGELLCALHPLSAARRGVPPLPSVSAPPPVH